MLVWMFVISAFSCFVKPDRSNSDTRSDQDTNLSSIHDSGATTKDDTSYSSVDDTTMVGVDSDSTTLDSVGDTSSHMDTNSTSTVTDNVGTKVYKAIAAGWWRTLAITIDGSIDCWGDCNEKNLPDGSYDKICAEGGYACVYTASGEYRCWQDTVPVAGGAVSDQPSGLLVRDLSCGGEFVCAIQKNDGALGCWGLSDGGEDDYGQVTDAPTGFENIRSVHAGYYHACLIEDDGNVVCWGSNRTDESEPIQGDYLDIKGGWESTCALGGDGQVVCWGTNSLGYNKHSKAHLISELSGMGRDYLCGIDSSGGVYCWGNSGEELYENSSSYQEVAVSLYHVCALDEDGYAHCWGNDYYGQSSPP